MIDIVICIAKFFLSLLYGVFKLRKTKENKVTFISRQLNTVSDDFFALQNALLRQNQEMEFVVLCKKIGPGFGSKLLYAFHIIKQMWHIANSSTCVIDGYIIPVSILNHKDSLLIIQLWHAVGTVKKFGYQTLGKEGGRNEKLSKSLCMHKNYGIILSGSQMMIDVFAEAFHAEKTNIMVCSPPKITYMQQNYDSIQKNIYEQFPVLQNKKTVLYAPTYRQNGVYHIQQLLEVFDFDQYNLIIKCHPARKLSVTDDRVITCPHISAFHLISVADYVITDYSAISIEAAIFHKPVFIYAYDYEEYIHNVGLNIDIKNELSPYFYSDIETLLRELEKPYSYEQLDRYACTYYSHSAGENLDKLCCSIVSGGAL